MTDVQDVDRPLRFADQVNAFMEERVPRMHSMGIRVVDLERGRVVAEAPFEGNGNHLGSMYAGTLFGLAEMLGGALVIPIIDLEAFYPTVKNVTIHYRRPARSDIRATATLDPEVIPRVLDAAERDGRAEFVVEAQLEDDSGSLVATSHGIYQVRAIGT